jgi:RNA methyltransferase, TrmH family
VLSRAEQKLIRRLARPGRKRDEPLFLAEGVRVVEELVDSNIVLHLATVSSSLEDNQRGEALLRRLRERAPVRVVPASELNRIAATESPQGVLAVAEVPRRHLHDLPLPERAVLLVLDGVQDPGNLGTMARSSAAFGCALIACLPGTVDPWNAKAVRSAAGALFRTPVAQPAAGELWEWLDRHGVAVWGADAAGEAIARVVPPPRIALVLGNEGAGIGPATRARCERLVAVPMRGGSESLNVAVAAGILLYEITRERP